MAIPQRKQIFQARGEGTGGLWTSPQRDLVYLFPDLCRETFHEFIHLRPGVTEMMERYGVTVEDLNPVAKDIAHFINNIHTESDITKEDGTVEKEPNIFLKFPNSRIDALAVFGYQFLRHIAFHFAYGVREVTHPGKNDAPDFTDITSELEDLPYVTWRDKWQSIKVLLKGIWRIIKA